MPYNYDKNCVVYIGTHDNDTILGWKKEMDEETIAFCRDFLDIDKSCSDSEFVWKFIKTAFACVGDTVIIQMQDYLELAGGARMNIPSTLGDNWQWRAGANDFSDELAEKIAAVTRIYGRCAR